MQKSRRVALVVFLFLAAAGVADGIYLTSIHLQGAVDDTYSSSACHALSEHGCDIAVKSPWSEVSGVPVSLAGAALDASLVLLALLALVSKVPAVPTALLFLFGIVGVLVSLLMAGVSVVSGSFCPFCAGWYVINLGLLVCAWWALESSPFAALRTAFGAFLRPHRGVGVVVFAVSFGAAVGGGLYAYHRIEKVAIAAHRVDPKDVARITDQIVAAGPLAPFDISNAAAKGPAEDAAAVHIVEFSDFQCPYCRKLWDTLESVYGDGGGTIRMTFVNFPLNSKCNPFVSSELHPYACDAARAAECARRRGKFWEYADILFHNQASLEQDDLLAYGKRLGIPEGELAACMASGEVSDKLLADIGLAAKLGVASTPTFFVNGYKAEGAMRKPYVTGLIERVGRK